MKLNIKKRLAAIREERGATDPILVLATIAVSLILLVGGTFAVTGIITNGKDLNAKGDLDKISIAETAYYAENDTFAAYEKGTASAAELEDSGLGFNPTEDADTKLLVVTTPSSPGVDGGWRAASKSSSDKIFVKTSESNLIITAVGYEAGKAPTAADAAKLGFADAAALVAFANTAK